MGILDDIRPTTKKSRPTELGVLGPNLAVTWDDGRKSAIPLRFLRQQCPCAACVDEWSGKRTLDPESVPVDVKPVKMTPIGRYAVQVGWSDGHGSGIYSWDLLRELSGQA